jgi:hypothetical protein
MSGQLLTSPAGRINDGTNTHIDAGQAILHSVCLTLLWCVSPLNATAVAIPIDSFPATSTRIQQLLLLWRISVFASTDTQTGTGLIRIELVRLIVGGTKAQAARRRAVRPRAALRAMRVGVGVAVGIGV